MPEGKLRCARRGNQVLYFRRMVPEDPAGQYIKKKDRPLAAALAQKDYNTRVLRAAWKELQYLRTLMKYEDRQKVEYVYNNLDESRQVLIKPVAVPDRQFIEEWKQESFQSKGFPEGSPEYYTGSGIRVRSKSEILIADTLDRYKVPFRYEYPLSIKGHGTIHPDFTVLNVRERKEYLWEHLGMMDDPDYSERALCRIEQYESDGYFPGEQLIITHETSMHPLNTKLINKLIKRYLL